MYVSAAIAHAVAAAARDRGIPPEELFDKSAIGGDLLREPTGLLPRSDYNRLVKTAYELSGDAALGLHCGELAPMGMLHVVGHMLSSSATLRDGFALVQRFWPLIDQGARFTLLEGATRARLVYESGQEEPLLRRFCAEICLSFTHRVARQLLGVAGSADAVWFDHSITPYAAEYRRIFSCELRFDAGANAILFPSPILDERLLLGNAVLADNLRQLAEMLMARQLSEHDLPSRIFRMLQNEPNLADVDAGVVAGWLSISPRTLRRRLSGFGRPLSSLLDDVRRERALTALARPDSNVKELAEQLGFSEPSALHRAFKRWTGRSIGDYRHSVAADD